MRYATNIEHDGGCPDCERYERQIGRMNARESELQQSKDEALTAYNLECKRNDDLQEENETLKAKAAKMQTAVSEYYRQWVRHGEIINSQKEEIVLYREALTEIVNAQTNANTIEETTVAFDFLQSSLNSIVSKFQPKKDA